jgi:TPR repeat protein
LEDGIGVQKSVSEAAREYKLSADQGNSDGQWHYGNCLERGEGVPQDQRAAAKYYGLSAGQGNSNGQCHYGRCFEYGIGIDPVSSSRGWWFSGGGSGAVQNLAKAAELYRLSAEQGNSDGEWHYGVCLDKGNGVHRDVARAMDYYKRSADQDNVEGQLRYQFQVIVEGRGLRRITLMATCFTPVLDLKQMIERKSGIQVGDQVVTYAGRTLDTGVLNAYGIQDTAQIQLSRRP